MTTVPPPQAPMPAPASEAPKGRYVATVACFILVVFCALIGGMSSTSSKDETTRLTATVVTGSCDDVHYAYDYDGVGYRGEVSGNKGCVKVHTVGATFPVWIDPSDPGNADVNSPTSNRVASIVFLALGLIFLGLRGWYLVTSRKDRTTAGTVVAWIFGGVSALILLSSGLTALLA